MEALRPVSEAGTSPEQVIQLLVWARDYLALVETPREAARLVRQADAIRYLAQKADAADEVRNQAAEVALRARRRLGELLCQEGFGRHGGDRRSRDRVSLDQLGISAKESQRCCLLVAVPEERFERHVAEQLAAGRELTQAGVLRLARAYRREGEEEVERRETCPTCGGRGWVVVEEER